MDSIVTTCNNCGAAGREVLYAEGVAQKHQIVSCTNCGLLYAYPRTGAALDDYIAADATPLSLGSPSVIRSYDKLPDYEPVGVELRRYLPAGGELLEVGAHAGVLLESFRRQGWKVAGVEPDPVAAEFARAHFGLDVSPTTLEGAKYERGRFDAVVMLHVIEHLDDPAATVRTIHSVLRPGGILVVETPIYDTLMFRLLGSRERSLNCDGHIVFYTERTLTALLEKLGFEIVDKRRVGRSMSIGRLLWNLGVMSKWAALQRAIDRLNDRWGLLRRGRLYLNARDMMRVYARRKPT
jgi:2-polyprenyl-3-methyl-5-hydroxy-6-metoxy-1,4-benzoquinol methylase